MAQKAVRSEASAPNSLGPERDWPEVRGEECRPRTVLSWLLAKWVVGESEEAGRRTLSSHGPENPEEKEIALSLKRWDRNKTKQKIPPPGPPPGKERRCSQPSPEKEQTPTSPGCPRHGRFVDFVDHLGPGWDAGGPLSCERLDAPAYVSIRPGAEQLWRTQEGAHGDGQTEAWPRGQAGMVATRRGRMCWIASVCCCTRRELLGEALNGVAEQPSLGDGGIEKACLVDVLHLCRLSPEMALLDHHGGHRLPEGTTPWLSSLVERSQSPCASSCINPGSVLLPRAPVWAPWLGEPAG